METPEDWRIGRLERVICDGLGNSIRACDRCGVAGMSELGMQVIMDYTSVPIGLWIVGNLWTGQPTRSTATCPSCGRIGVISALEHGKRIIVHTGRVVGDTLVGIDYCELGNEENHHHLSRIDPNSRLYMTPASRTQGQRVIYAAAIAADDARQDNQRKNYAKNVDEVLVRSPQDSFERT